MYFKTNKLVTYCSLGLTICLALSKARFSTYFSTDRNNRFLYFFLIHAAAVCKKKVCKVWGAAY